MRLRQFLRAERGGVSVLTAVSSLVLIGFTGLATDIGSVYLESRRLQGAADLAAIAAAADPGDSESSARDTARANGWERADVDVELGVYTPDRAIDPRARFVADRNGANAARVTLTSTAPLFFGRLFVASGEMTIRRTATAAQNKFAAFQVGTRLLALEGGVANQILSGLTGSEVRLSVMDYNALLDADVALLGFADALRTRLELQGATYEETLARRVDPPVALAALADALERTDRRAASAARRLSRDLDNTSAQMSLDRVIDLGPLGEQDEILLESDTRFRANAMDMATAMLEVAGGDRQVRLDLGASAPGLADLDIWLAIGERPNRSPWLSVTEDYDVVLHTEQMRLYVEARALGSGPLAGLGGLRVPILAEVAPAQARLGDVRCGFGADVRSVRVDVAPGVAALTLGDIDVHKLDDFRTPLRPAPAQLLRAGAVRIEGEARIEVGGRDWRELEFSARDIDSGAIKSAATRDAAHATLASLLAETRLSVRAGGLGLGAGALSGAAAQTLSAAARPLDAILNGVTDLLGVRLGEADVRVNGARCGGAALVA